MAFTIKQGDTSPALVASLTTGSGQPVSLAGATVLFHIRGTRSSTAKTAPATVVDAANGRVRYEWTADDTAVAGDFECEFEVTYSDGSIETFPNDDYIEVTIPAQIA
jgi:hypothetical protein